MGLGDLVSSAASSIFGDDDDKSTPSGSNLKGFISKFNSLDAYYVNTIDTLHTFDVQFAFYPMFDIQPDKKKKKSIGEKIGDSLLSAGKEALYNLGNNLTGGLMGSLLDDSKLKGKDIISLRNKFLGESNAKMTIVDYLARGNLMNDPSNMMKPQLIMDLSYYIQNIQLPNLTIPDGGMVDSYLGQFPVNGKYVKPSQNTLQINVINTKAPIAERVFYPWMREVTLPYWSYDDQPYTTATVTINFTKHTDIQYVFVNCRPTNIEAIQPSNELGTPTRMITLTFDYMFVLSDKLKSRDTTTDNLLGLGKSLLNSAGGMLGI